MVAGNAQRFGGDGDRLSMIAGRIRDHAARQVVVGNRQDEVGRAPDLERAAALEVFALEEDAGAGQAHRRCAT